MSSQRYTPEFKDEAVRQVVDRGYSVAEVADRLGVSTHSLYKWVKAIRPDKSEQQASELTEAKREVLKLRAQLRRAEEERDILKKAAVLCKPARAKYQIILEHRDQFKVATMCRVLWASRSGFYAWVHKPLSDRAIEDQRLLILIRDSYAASSGV